MLRFYRSSRRYLAKMEYLNSFAGLFYFLVCGLIVWGIVTEHHIFFSNWKRILFTCVIFLPIVLYGVHRVVYYIHEADNFHRGRRGERAVREELFNLPDEYRVFEDITFHSRSYSNVSNIDFVVVGPTGVFTIEVKPHRGYIGLRDGELTQNLSFFADRDVLKQAKGAVMALRYNLELTHKGAGEVPIYSVIVFSSRVARMGFGVKPVDGVFVLPRDLLREVILHPSSDKRILSAQEVSLLEKTLKDFCK